MASDEQFSLCWNNFHANMSAGFHGLLSRGDLVDVTLAAEGRLLQAHKLVLSVCSPYFQEMFKMNPTQHPIVFLKDVSHSALRDLLQFMYQGEVNVKQEELASFINTAEQLQVKGLTGNQNEESSTPCKPKPTSRPGPRSSQQRQSVMKLETDLDTKPSSTPVAIKRPNRPSIASNNSSSSQSGPAKRKCVDPLEAGPSGSAKDEFVTIPDEDENNAVAPKMEPEFVNESMWDDDDDGANNDETNFGEDDSNMEMTGFDGSATGDGNISGGGGEGGAVGDAQVPSALNKNYTSVSDNNGCQLLNKNGTTAAIANKHDPVTYKDAINSSEAAEWNEGIKRELKALEDNNTWTSTPLPPGKKAISSKLILMKTNDALGNVQYKCRLVARGFEQENKFDLNEFYSPVVKLLTVRTFVALATKLNLPIHQMDVCSAFLNGEIKQEVYMYLPKEFHKENCVVKLKKSIYGLKSSPKNWNEKFETVIKKQGFIQSSNDFCLYTKITKKFKIFMLLNVDDIFLFDTDNKETENVKSFLSNNFKIKDMGHVSEYLGINIKQDLVKGTTVLNQTEYLNNVYN